MSRKEAPGRGFVIAVIAMIAAFLASVFWIANRVMTRAPVYSEYSSMRSDPRGAKALYDTFAAIPSVTVERNMRRLARLAEARATVLWLGENVFAAAFWDKVQLGTFERIAQSGGRVVIAFRPAGPAYDDGRDKREVRKDRRTGKELVPELVSRWRIQLERGTTAKFSESDDASLRESAVWITPLSPEWRCTEERAGKCRMVERSFGAGTVVLLTDTFFLSNEGLRESRQAAKIAALAGGSRRIIFDETHLGIEDSGSIGTLIRQFRLEGAALMLVTLAGLFIWRNSTSLLPTRAPEPDHGLAGDAHRSMTLLLRRAIAPVDLASACLQEWRKARALLPFHHQRVMNKVPTATAALETWKSVRKALTEKS